jgi:drug/metabolite transporter (DMT)-like permease
MGGNVKGALLALLAFGIFSTHDVVVKYLGGLYSPVQIVFFSVLLGFPIVTLMLMRDRTDGNLRPRHPWWTALRTAAAVVTGLSAFYAFSELPLAQTYAILFASPLLITVLAIPILGEKVRLRRGLAVVVGLIGVLIVLRPGETELGLGHLAALAAAICGSLSSIIVRKIGSEERSVVLLLYPMMANFVVMACLLPFFYVPMPIYDLAALGLIAAFAFVATLLVILAYRAGEAVIIAPMQYSQILWAAAYGYLFFGESLDLYTVVGASVIIASGIYILLREGRGDVSENQPVLQTRSRAETGTMPRVSLLDDADSQGTDTPR